jgi:16S rRNA C1402 N4-methylase RsmH
MTESTNDKVIKAVQSAIANGDKISHIEVSFYLYHLLVRHCTSSHANPYSLDATNFWQGIKVEVNHDLTDSFRVALIKRMPKKDIINLYQGQPVMMPELIKMPMMP